MSWMIAVGALLAASHVDASMCRHGEQKKVSDDLYLDCVGGFWTSKNCESGTAYDEAHRGCKSRIRKSPISQPAPFPRISCNFTSELYADPTSCDRYYQCVDHLLRKETCPPNELFDIRFGACNEASKALCVPSTTEAPPRVKTSVQRTKFEPFLCPEPSGKFPHPSSCSHYYDCYPGIVHLKKCPYGTRFDASKGYCVSSESVVCEETPSDESFPKETSRKITATRQNGEAGISAGTRHSTKIGELGGDPGSMGDFLSRMSSSSRTFSSPNRTPPHSSMISYGGARPSTAVIGAARTHIANSSTSGAGKHTVGEDVTFIPPTAADPTHSKEGLWKIPPTESATAFPSINSAHIPHFQHMRTLPPGNDWEACHYPDSIAAPSRSISRPSNFPQEVRLNKASNGIATGALTKTKLPPAVEETGREGAPGPAVRGYRETRTPEQYPRTFPDSAPQYAALPNGVSPPQQSSAPIQSENMESSNTFPPVGSYSGQSSANSELTMSPNSRRRGTFPTQTTFERAQRTRTPTSPKTREESEERRQKAAPNAVTSTGDSASLWQGRRRLRMSNEGPPTTPTSSESEATRSMPGSYENTRPTVVHPQGTVEPDDATEDPIRSRPVNGIRRRRTIGLPSAPSDSTHSEKASRSSTKKPLPMGPLHELPREFESHFSTKSPALEGDATMPEMGSGDERIFSASSNNHKSGTASISLEGSLPASVSPGTELSSEFSAQSSTESVVSVQTPIENSANILTGSTADSANLSNGFKPLVALREVRSQTGPTVELTESTTPPNGALNHDSLGEAESRRQPETKSGIHPAAETTASNRDNFGGTENKAEGTESPAEQKPRILEELSPNSGASGTTDKKISSASRNASSLTPVSSAPYTNTSSSTDSSHHDQAGTTQPTSEVGGLSKHHSTRLDPTPASTEAADQTFFPFPEPTFVNATDGKHGLVLNSSTPEGTDSNDSSDPLFSIEGDKVVAMSITELDEIVEAPPSGNTSYKSEDIRSPLASSAPSSISKTVNCPQPFGWFPDPNSCEHFYQCTRARGIRMLCPEGMHFNERVKVCDTIAKARCRINS